MNPFLEIVLRSLAVYVFIILAIRLFGKKELSQLSITDLVLILLISNAVQNAMVGEDTSLQGGLLAALTLFLLNYLIKIISFRSKLFSNILEGQPVMLVYKGFINADHLRAQKLTMEELEAVVREHGLEKVEQAELVMLEKDGSISVISKELKNQTIHKRKRVKKYGDRNMN
ncbi:MAG: YetF domain-containing protein [Bacteroidota bacterium]